MSLETNLQLNNELVAKNNELLNRLIQSLSAGVALHTDAEKQMQSYVEEVLNDATSTDLELKPESPDIESLDIRIVTALANLFGEKAKNLTPEQVEKARAYENGNKRDNFTDALSLALIDCNTVKKAPRAVLLDLCIVMLAHWSAMATLEERRAFAERYIKTPYNKRADLVPHKAEVGKTPEPDASEPEPDNATLFEQAKTLIMKLTTGGYRSEALEILDKFGAKKLGQVPADKLPELITAAELALEA